MNKNMKKLLLIVFIVAIILIGTKGIENTYAGDGCSEKSEAECIGSISNDGHKCKKVFKPSASSDYICTIDTSRCGSGYEMSEGKCYKSISGSTGDSSNALEDKYWFVCGDTCKGAPSSELSLNSRLSVNQCDSTAYSTKRECNKARDVSLTKVYKNDTSKTSSTSYDKADAAACEKNGNYYNSNSSIADVGCYQLEAYNCSFFGFYWDGSTCQKEKSKSKVSFDYNYGYGLLCDGVTSYETDGVCSGYVNDGTEISAPSSSKDMYRLSEGNGPNDQGLLIGWSKSFYCNNKDIIPYNQKIKVSGNTYLYACYRENIGGERYVAEGAITDGGEQLECGTKIWFEYCKREDTGNYCYYLQPGTTDVYRKVYRDKIKDAYKDANCSGKSTKQPSSDPVDDFSEEPVEEANPSDTEVNEEKSCTNVGLDRMRKTSLYTVCYNKSDSAEKVKEYLEKYYVCDNDAGYYFDKTSAIAQEAAQCNNYICKRTYSVTCTKGQGARPTMVVTSGVVESNGYGKIKVEAKSVEGTIDSYFVSDYYTRPTAANTWTRVNGNVFEIEASPGIKYIWVRDSNGNISNTASGAVLDTVHTNTTVNKLQLKDSNGNMLTPSRTVGYKSDEITDVKYVRLSNNIGIDSEVLADGFNPFDMEYKLEVSGPTVTVFATLTSTDSKFVDGYEPRTVNLNYGVNTVLIKIQNNEGIIRTYTILVTRNDERSSDNTLNDISLSAGKITFNSNVTDYKVIIPKDTNSVNVDAKISSNKASFVSGYEPGEVITKEDSTVKLIKVMSETGSVRTYVLTFIKKGTDKIIDTSIQLSDLVIPGVNIAFDSEVSNYSFSVEYDVDSISINPILKDESGHYDIYIDGKSTSKVNIPLKVGENHIEISVSNNYGVVGTYKLTVIRKEFGLDIASDYTLKDLKVLGYNIKFRPTKKDYTVRIKQEKSLVITAVPNSNRAEVFITGNEELTGFSTVRVKVVAENGDYETYSIDIKKDAFNKTIEIASIIIGAVIIIVSSCIIVIKKKSNRRKEYYEE